MLIIWHAIYLIYIWVMLYFISFYFVIFSNIQQCFKTFQNIIKCFWDVCKQHFGTGLCFQVLVLEWFGSWSGVGVAWSGLGGVCYWYHI